MNETEKVIRTDHVERSASGDAVVHETSRQVDTTASPKTTTINTVWYLYGVIAILLSLRFIMKLAGANSANGFVDFIYSVAGLFLLPFSTIFRTATVAGETIRSTFEPSILVAILMYGLIAFGITKLITLNENRQ